MESAHLNFWKPLRATLPKDSLQNAKLCRLQRSTNEGRHMNWWVFCLCTRGQRTDSHTKSEVEGRTLERIREVLADDGYEAMLVRSHAHAIARDGEASYEEVTLTDDEHSVN